MKKNMYLNIFLLLVSFNLFLPKCFASSESPFKNAQVQYRLMGIRKGTENLYLKEKNMRSITSMNSPKGESLIVLDIMSISQGDELIIVDLNQKIAIKQKTIFTKKFNEMSSEDIIKYHRRMLLGIENLKELKKIGKEVVLGKECIIYKVLKGETTNKLWIWNNLILKSEMNGSQPFNKIAVDLKLDTEMPDSLFIIPPDIEIIDRTEM